MGYSSGKLMRRALSVALFFVTATGLFAQSPSFTASTNAREVVQGNTFQINFELENAEGENFRQPSFRDFAVVGSRGVSNSMTIVNGKISRSTTYSYTLQAKKTGEFEIGPATIEVNSKKLSTNPVTIKVVKGKPAQKKEQETGETLSSGEVFIRAELSDDTAYVGQQLLLDYKLYTTLDVQNYSLVQESSYSGFFSEDVRYFDSGVMQEVIDGIQYTTKVLKRVALFPQQQGALKIDPLTMTVGLGLRRGLFSRLPSQYLNIATLPVGVEVLPLPAGAPESFTGAVGDYEVRAGDLRGQIFSGEALTIQFLVSGFGDIKRLQAPRLIFPDTFEVYEPKVASERNFEKDGKIAGEKLFEWVVVPGAAGRFQIPWSFTVFDPDRAGFRLIRSDTLPLFVQQGKQRSSAGALDEPTSSQDEIHPIALDTKLNATSSLNPYHSFFFWLFALLPVGLLLGALFFRPGNWLPFSRKKGKTSTGPEALQAARQHLKEENQRPFYESLSRCLLQFASQKLGRSAQNMNRYELEKALEKQGMAEENLQTFTYLLNACDLALFGGGTQAFSKEELLEKARSIVEA